MKHDEFVKLSLPIEDWRSLIALLVKNVDHMSFDELAFFNKLLIHIRDKVADISFELQTK